MWLNCLIIFLAYCIAFAFVLWLVVICYLNREQREEENVMDLELVCVETALRGRAQHPVTP